MGFTVGEGGREQSMMGGELSGTASGEKRTEKGHLWWLNLLPQNITVQYQQAVRKI